MNFVMSSMLATQAWPTLAVNESDRRAGFQLKLLWRHILTKFLRQTVTSVKHPAMVRITFNRFLHCFNGGISISIGSRRGDCIRVGLNVGEELQMLLLYVNELVLSFSKLPAELTNLAERLVELV